LDRILGGRTSQMPDFLKKVMNNFVLKEFTALFDKRMFVPFQIRTESVNEVGG
jgi:hypothetical protein